MEYLFDLERAVEAVEQRVPLGKPAVRVLLSAAILYALLAVFRSLALDFFWPWTQFVTTEVGYISAYHVRPNLLPTLPWIFAGFVLGFLAYLANRLLDKMVGRVRELEIAVKKYREIFWQPLDADEKKSLIARLQAIGPHLVAIMSHENTDCVELASDLKGCFEAAKWPVRQTPLTGTYASLGLSGFHVTTRGNPYEMHRALIEALMGASRGPISGTSGGPLPPDSITEVEIAVGPRRLRND